jgi:TonB family protein
MLPVIFEILSSTTAYTVLPRKSYAYPMRNRTEAPPDAIEVPDSQLTICPAQYSMVMEQRGLPFSRIRCPRSDAGGFTVQSHRATHLVAFAEPAYPSAAQTQGIEGTVLIDAVIDREGNIMELSGRTGHERLAESALETVRHWQYRPTTINGIPVEVQTEIQVTFTLPNSVVSS